MLSYYALMFKVLHLFLFCRSFVRVMYMSIISNGERISLVKEEILMTFLSTPEGLMRLPVM